MKRKKSQAASSLAPAPAPAVPPAPVVPLSPVQQQPVAQPVVSPAPVPAPSLSIASEAPASPVQPAPVTQPVAQPVSEPIAQPVSTPDPIPAAKSLNISPSELVVLRGDAFSPSAGPINSYPILGTDQKVHLPTLVKATFAAAFLSLREAGDVRLEMGKRKATLGLRELNTINVVPTGTSSSWPEGSYEAAFLMLAQDAAAKQQNNVSHLVYSALGREDQVPTLLALNITRGPLQKRGILDVEQGKGVLGIKTTKYILPPASQAALAQADVDSLKALLERVKQAEPELWKLLENEIMNGVRDRTASSD